MSASATQGGHNKHKIHIHKNESKLSEMGLVRQNTIQRTVKLFKKLSRIQEFQLSNEWLSYCMLSFLLPIKIYCPTRENKVAPETKCYFQLRLYHTSNNIRITHYGHRFLFDVFSQIVQGMIQQYFAKTSSLTLQNVKHKYYCFLFPFVLSNIPHTPHHNHFMALFPGPPGWASARRELLDFMVQGKINRGRHTDHPAGCHFLRTNQCPPPPSPHFFTVRMPFLPPNQQCQSTIREPKFFKQMQLLQTNEAGIFFTCQMPFLLSSNYYYHHFPAIIQDNLC